MLWSGARTDIFTIYLFCRIIEYTTLNTDSWNVLRSNFKNAVVNLILLLKWRSSRISCLMLFEALMSPQTTRNLRLWVSVNWDWGSFHAALKKPWLGYENDNVIAECWLKWLHSVEEVPCCLLPLCPALDVALEENRTWNFPQFLRGIYKILRDQNNYIWSFISA